MLISKQELNNQVQRFIREQKLKDEGDNVEEKKSKFLDEKFGGTLMD